MKKRKRLLAKMSDEIKELVKKFPLTMCIIVFITLFFTITMDYEFSKDANEIVEKMYMFCAIWIIGTIFTETFFASKTKKIASYGITGGISLAFTQILTSAMSKSTGETTTYRFLEAYLLVLILISIYKSIQNAKLKFEEYLLKVFRDLFHTTVIYVILNIGIILVASIFVELILDGKYGNVIERLLALLFGLFYVPSMIYSFSGISKKEIGSFIKGLVSYVLLPLVTIAIAIIYIYIAKIIILRDMPQNIIFRILAGIFMVAFPVWNMASNDRKDKKLVGKIVKILPYLYAPFIVLEMYSIGARINEFGVTPARYMCCAFVVFQIIALALTFYKKSAKISHICIYASVFVVILFVSPFHYEKVSNWSQKGIIEKKMPENVDFDELSDEDKASVKGAYEYLKYEASNDEKSMPSYLTEENETKIQEYSKSDRRHYNDSAYISLDCPLNLNVQEYSQITFVESKIGDDYENGIVTLEGTTKTIDLRDKIDEIISKNEIIDLDLEEDFKDNNILPISETEDLYISELVFDYEKEEENLSYLRMEGYLLER